MVRAIRRVVQGMPHHECMSVDEGVGPGRLKFLLDSNVVIAVRAVRRGLRPGRWWPLVWSAWLTSEGHLLCVAQATRDDLAEGRDGERRARRAQWNWASSHLLQKVPLQRLPSWTRPELAIRARTTIGTCGFWRAFEAGAATHLVTEDGRLRRRAVRAGNWRCGVVSGGGRGAAGQFRADGGHATATGHADTDLCHR